MPPAVAPPEAVPAARSNGAWMALGIGGGLLGVGAIVAVLFMTVLKPTPAEPVAPVQPPVAVAAVPPPPAQPVAVAPPVAPPALRAAAQPAAPEAAEPAQAAAAPAEPENKTAAAEAKQEAAPEPKKEEKAPEPAKVDEPDKKETRVASRDRRTTTRKEPERTREPEQAAPPPPQPAREEVAVAPSRSKVDDDFERIFGGGGSSDAAPEPKKEEKKSRTAYVPPPVGSATKSKLEQSDIMEVVVGNKSAIKRCVEEQKAQDPGASGTIVMRWIIKPDGRTANIQTMTGEFKKTPMSSCMASAIKGWKFPAYAGSQMPPIDFPFKF